MLGLECKNTVCSRDVDVDQTDRRRSEAFEMQIWRRMEKIQPSQKVLRRVNEDRQITELYLAKEMSIDWPYVLRHDGLSHEIIEGTER